MRGNITPNGWGSLDINIGKKKKSPLWVQVLLSLALILFLFLCIFAPQDPVCSILGF